MQLIAGFRKISIVYVCSVIIISLKENSKDVRCKILRLKELTLKNFHLRKYLQVIWA